MVYISNDGRVLQSSPFGLNKIYAFFSGIVFMIVMFFQTLVYPAGTSAGGSQYSRGSRPGFGPPRPPNRRIGRPNTGDSINIPFGGCRSCAG